MAEKCSLSIKRLLQISLAIMLLFLLIISVLYYLFIYMTMPFRERHQREMKQGWCFRNRV